MGYIRHHAIVVTSFQRDVIEDAREKARTLFAFSQVSRIGEGTVNSQFSFCVFPDGSKEGWSESEEGDEGRAAFTAYLRSLAYDDGSTPVDWVEVQFGDDNKETKIVDHSDRAPLGDPA